MYLASSFTSTASVIKLLHLIRSGQFASARRTLYQSLLTFPDCPLLQEILFQLERINPLSILIDGIWFSSPYGGISRVWSQFFSFLESSVFIDINQFHFILRGDTKHPPHLRNLLHLPYLDPLNYEAFEDESIVIYDLMHKFSFDIFCSSWITYAAKSSRYVQLALVHDCIPERFPAYFSRVLTARRKWISSSDAFVCVSSRTTCDLIHFFPSTASSVCWAHPDSTYVFSRSCSFSSPSVSDWKHLLKRSGLPSRFVLFPGSSSLSSYKNPRLLGQALSSSLCSSIELVVCGLSASTCVSELESAFPALRGRIHAAGFTDDELFLVYKNCLAVVIPSLYEGFGLPATEVIASGGLALIADSPGLTEAGCEAALRFSPIDHHQLSLLLQLAAHPPSRSYLLTSLRSRYISRLSRMHPDLLPLAILAHARKTSALSRTLD